MKKPTPTGVSRTRRSRSCAFVPGAAFVVLGFLSTTLLGQTGSGVLTTATPRFNKPGTSLVFSPLTRNGAAEPVLNLQPISIAELSPSTDRLGTHERTSIASARKSSAKGLSVVLSGPQEGLKTRVRREIPRLFEYYVPPNTHASDLNFDYQLRSASGEPNQLDTGVPGESSIHVIVRPTPPIILDSQPGATILQGGVVLELDLQDVTRAGSYEGSLTVVINHL